MAQTVSQVSFDNKPITIMDYTNCGKEELLNRVKEVMSWIVKQPKESLLTITDVTDQRFDKDIIEAFKQLALNNKPFVKAGAIVGIKGLLKIAYTAVMKFSGRSMPIFNTRNDAMNWLVKQ